VDRRRTAVTANGERATIRCQDFRDRRSASATWDFVRLSTDSDFTVQEPMAAVVHGNDKVDNTTPLASAPARRVSRDPGVLPAFDLFGVGMGIRRVDGGPLESGFVSDTIGVPATRAPE